MISTTVRKLITPLLIGIVLLQAVPLGWVHAAEARVTLDQLGPVTIATETGEELMAVGCTAHTVPSAHQPITIEVGEQLPRPVISPEAVSAEGLMVWLCSREQVAQLSVTGQILAAEALAQGVQLPGFGDIGKGVGKAANAGLELISSGWSLGKKAIDPTGLLGINECGILKPVGLFLCLTRFVLTSADKTGTTIIKWLVLGIVPLLTSGFLTNPFVKGGWPFILGVANLGFVLALLFIAALTILKSAGGFDVRRALVRLLIAAVLINFSLLIATVIIDVSRFFMAVIYRGMVGHSISELPVDLLGSADHFKRAFYQIDHANPLWKAGEEAFRVGLNIVGGLPTGGQVQIGDTFFNIRSLGPTAYLFLGVFLTWVMVIALLVLLVGLLARYLMLIFLLITSPLAYLAFALPIGEGMWRQWWERFLKYVFYGPAVTFMLAILALMGQDRLGLKSFFSSTLHPIVADLGKMAITIGMLIMTAKIGKWSGGWASQVMTQRLEGLGKFARRHPIITGAVVAGPVAGAAGGVGLAGAATVAGGGAVLAGVGLGKAGLAFGKKVAVHYAADKIAESRKIMAKAGSGDMTPEEIHKMQKDHPYLYRAAKLGEKISPLFGGWGFNKGPILDDAAHHAAAKASIAHARTQPNPKQLMAAAAANPAHPLHPVALSTIDDNLEEDESRFLLEDGTHEMKKVILKEPKVHEKLEKTAAGRQALENIFALETKEERVDVGQVRVDLRATIKRNNPGIGKDDLNERVEDQLPNMLNTLRQQIDQTNKDRKANKELVDAAGKGREAWQKEKRLGRKS